MIRITGLTSLSNTVRRALAGPVSAAHKAELQATVREGLDTIGKILQKHRATPAELSAPTRRALHWLASIDWDRVATTETAAPGATAPRIVTFPGLTTFVARAAHRLTDGDAGESLAAIHQSIAGTSRRIESTIARKKFQPENFSDTTREHRAWVAYFAERANLDRYLVTLRTATPILDRAVKHSYARPLRVHFRPTGKLYRLRDARTHSELLLPTAMLSFDEAALRALAALMSRRDPSAREQVLTTMQQPAYQTLLAELESLGGVVETHAGHAHDLLAAFHRVNHQYFQDRMARPKLTWSQSFTGRKFGHYDFAHDTVMLSRTLDAPTVPAYVVDFVLYHELLHKHHGIRWANGRSYAHTPEFYADEKRFAQYKEAEATLQKLARGPLAVD